MSGPPSIAIQSRILFTQNRYCSHTTQTGVSERARVRKLNKRRSRDSLLKPWRNPTLLPTLLTFLEVAACLLKYLIQVSVTRVDAHLKAESWEAKSYNQYVCLNKPKSKYWYQNIWYQNVWQPQLCSANKLQNYLLSVVFPIKPFILFTIIKHKNVFFFIWPQESPKVVRKSWEFSC